MGRNEQLRESSLSRLGPVYQRPGMPNDDQPESVESRPDDESSGRFGIGALPSWLAPQEDSEDLSPDSVRDLLDGDDPDRLVVSDDHLPHRVLPAPPAALALVVVGILAVVVAAVVMVRNTPADIGPVNFPSSAGPTASRVPLSTKVAGEQSAPSSATTARLVISVVGLVHRPGLVHLRPQARIADALAAAGGPRPGADLLSLNLARPLHDGDQIIVGFSGDGNRRAMRSAVIAADEAGLPGPGGQPVPEADLPSGASGKVDLNTATAAQLDALPGVGPVTAAAIIEWRNRNGRFTSVDQLAEVEGIGPGRLAKLRDKVTV